MFFSSSYIFYMFNHLYKLGKEVEISECQDVFTCAATDNKSGSALLIHFNDDENTKEKQVAFYLTIRVLVLMGETRFTI